MHRLTDKAPKPGKVVQVHLFKDPTGKAACVYFGMVQESSSKKILRLGGVYENTPPLKGCVESGKFVPILQETISFPRRVHPGVVCCWKSVPLQPSTVGQYFVYVNQKPVALSVVSTNQLTNRPTSKETNYLCVVGGTHAFYASDMNDVQLKLNSEELCAFPEYTNRIYDDMLALLTGTLQRKLLQTFSKTLHSAADETQATELKLCV